MSKARAWLMGDGGRALAVVLAVLCTWAYALGIGDAPTPAADLPPSIPTGPYSSDLYPRWLGTRELLQHGQDPYSEAVTAAIQQGMYGRVLTPTDPFQDQQGFAYPLTAVFLFAPLTLLPFETARLIVRLAVPILAGLSAVGWGVALGGWRGRRAQGVLFLLGASTLPVVSAFRLEQPSVLVVALLAGAAWCLTTRRLGLAGVLLALATIKPQLSAVPILWLLVWAAGAWPTRARLIGGFGGTLAALLAGAFLLVPGWLPEWVDDLRAYGSYTANQFVLGGMQAPATIGLVLLLSGVLLALAWGARQAEPGTEIFNLGLALSGLCSLFLVWRLVPYDEVLLYPAVLLILQRRATLLAFGLAGKILYSLILVLVLWPWALLTLRAVITLATGPLNARVPNAVLTVIYWLPNFLLPLLLLLPLGALVWHALRPARQVPLPGGGRR